MVDIEKLRHLLAQRGYSQRELAKMLGISERTLSKRMRERKFHSQEMQIKASALYMENPEQIFFAQKVSRHDT